MLSTLNVAEGDLHATDNECTYVLCCSDESLLPLGDLKVQLTEQIARLQ